MSPAWDRARESFRKNETCAIFGCDNQSYASCCFCDKPLCASCVTGGCLRVFVSERCCELVFTCPFCRGIPSDCPKLSCCCAANSRAEYLSEACKALCHPFTGVDEIWVDKIYWEDEGDYWPFNKSARVFVRDSSLLLDLDGLLFSAPITSEHEPLKDPGQKLILDLATCNKNPLF